MGDILQIRKYYESLSDEDKAKVLNIDKLVEAEKVISRYDVLSNKLDTYINSIDKHIKTDRVLPTDTYITLAYKNTSDAEKYNLTTGKRLKDYLSQQLNMIILLYQKTLISTLVMLVKTKMVYSTVMIQVV